jgi:hypothetical protein
MSLRFFSMQGIDPGFRLAAFVCSIKVHAVADRTSFYYGSSAKKSVAAYSLKATHDWKLQQIIL